MNDDELENLRRRRMEQLAADQDRAQGQAAAQAERQRQQEEQVEAVLRGALQPAARERLARIKISRPDFGRDVERQLVALAQSGRLARQLTDEDLVQILAQLQPKKRDISITRR